MPTTKEDCAKLGKNWCANSAASGSSAASGWCSANSCMDNPPAGKSHCPDGKSFASTLSDCPKKTSDGGGGGDEYKQCPDGTKIRKDTACYEPYKYCANGTRIAKDKDCPKEYTCPGGQKVDKATDCPADDPIAKCAEGGGAWCTDPSGTPAGFCAQKGSTCAASRCGQQGRVWCQGPFGIKDDYCAEKGATCDKQKIEDRYSKLTERQVRELTRQRSSWLRELGKMETTLTRSMKKVTAPELLKVIPDALTTIAALKTEVDKLQFTTDADTSVYKTTEKINDQLADVRQLYQDVLEAQQEASAKQLDAKARLRAANRMKKMVKDFKGFVARLQLKVTVLERRGIFLPPTLQKDITDEVTASQALLDQAAALDPKSDTYYEQISAIVEEIPDHADALNDLIGQLKRLAQLSRVRGLVEQQLNEANRIVRESIALAAKYELDIAVDLATMEQLTAEIKSTLTAIKDGTIEGDYEDVFEFVNETVVEKMDTIRELGAAMQTAANAQSAITQFTAELKSIEKRIGGLFETDRIQAKEFLAQARAVIAKIKATTSGRLTADKRETIIKLTSSLFTLRQQLYDLLSLPSPYGLEKKVQDLLEREAQNFEFFK